ncbi:MAG: nucleotidyltransferase domain-containing protein [Actinobacteria bacterium]|nr:nucleotidyltransferase domain-containing protein [Actinomycetota bacterium]
MSIWLDRDSAIGELRSAARLKDSCPEVKEVRLVGSLARGDHTGTSDADVLVVLRESRLNPVERLRRYIPFFDSGLGVDILPFTEEELNLLEKRETGHTRSLLKGSVRLA